MSRGGNWAKYLEQCFMVYIFSDSVSIDLNPSSHVLIKKSITIYIGLSSSQISLNSADYSSYSFSFYTTYLQLAIIVSIWDSDG
jgi:hypothetical protein